MAKHLNDRDVADSVKSMVEVDGPQPLQRSHSVAQTELQCWLEVVGLGQRVADQRCANPDRLQAKDVPVGITDIRLRFDVDSDATDEQLATLLKLTERYCVIVQTLRTPPRLSATLQRRAA